LDKLEKQRFLPFGAQRFVTGAVIHSVSMVPIVAVAPDLRLENILSLPPDPSRPRLAGPATRRLSPNSNVARTTAMRQINSGIRTIDRE
jgi:hypothetical protein